MDSLKIKEKIKKRLYFEIYLLENLILNYNLKSLRYSIDRRPILGMLHFARIYRLLRRYKENINSPFQICSDKYIEDFFKTEKRNLFFDAIKRSKSKSPGLLENECYQEIKIGEPFIHDGLNVAYNCMNSLNGEFIYMNFPDNSIYKDFIKDSARIFLRNENFFKEYPKNFEWHYSWGRMREGRTKEDRLSFNQPSYPPDHSFAHISYKSIDLIGLLVVNRFYPSIFPEKFKDYALDAVKNGGVYPFVYEELSDTKCTLHKNVATYYAFPLAPWEIQSASIAWLSLMNN